MYYVSQNRMRSEINRNIWKSWEMCRMWRARHVHLSFSNLHAEIVSLLPYAQIVTLLSNDKVKM